MNSHRATTDAPRDDRPRVDERANGRRIVSALTLTKAGDAVVDAKAVLPFLLAAGNAPAFLTGLLVPIRESGSLLPQAALSPRVQRVRQRRLLWSGAGLGQAAAVAVMAVLTATSTGSVLGYGLVAALAVFAIARSLASISFKDVLGRSVSAGRRGRVTGWATSAAGAIALTLGVALRFLGRGGGTTTFVVLLVGAAVAWVVAAAVFSRVEEAPPDDVDTPAPSPNPLTLLRDDATFRRFVTARTLLLASALSPPFVVALAVQSGGGGVGALGPFVIASGLASLLGGRAWGGAADRSSRRTMAAAAGLAAILLTLFLLARQSSVLTDLTAMYVGTHFLLSVVHAGARVARSTYVVDVAEGDRRTVYVSASNTAMGVLLLGVGAITGALASFGDEVALVALALVGVAGVPAALSLPATAAEARAATEAGTDGTDADTRGT